MMDDLMKNHLKKGMHRDSVLMLLGTPFKEQIEIMFAEGVKVPNSHFLDNSKEADTIKTWYQKNAQVDTMIFYAVGSSTIDPIILKIRMKEDSTVADFWIGE